MRLEIGVSALLALAGCAGDGKKEGEAAPKPAPVAVLEVTLDVPERAQIGDVVTVTATVTNKGETPVLVELAWIIAGGAPVARVEVQGHVAVPADGGGFAIEGDYEVEDLGPIARAPMPPRWTWKGAEVLYTAPVLAPGGALKVEGSFRVSPENTRVEARAEARPLPAGTPLLKVASWKAEAPAPPPGAGAGPGPARGWVVAARHRIALEPAPSVEAPGTERLKPEASGDLLLAGGPPPVVHRYFIKAGDRAKLGGPTGVRASRAIAADRLAFDLKAARERAKIPAGQTAYLVAAQAWALEAEDGGRVFLVGAERGVEVRGRVIPLVDRLNESGRAAVTLYRGEKELPGDDLPGKLAERGVAVRAEPEKGGTVRGVAEITPANVFAFLEELKARNRPLDGLEVAPPR